MTGPGFADVAVSVLEEGGEWPNVRRRRVGCEPAGIRYELSRAPDFDAFWTRTLEELAAVAPEVQVRPVPGEPADDFELSEVTLRSLGGVRVRGWLQVPRSKGPHAAVLRVLGYTENLQPIEAGNRVVFSFNIRAHGNSTAEAGPAGGLLVRGLDDEDDYFYRGAFMDCVRAMDYRARAGTWTRSGWPCGGEPGRPRLRHGPGPARGRASPTSHGCVTGGAGRAPHRPGRGGPRWVVGGRPDRTRSGALETLSYFDTMNLADRITCRTLMGVGLQDRICPPETSFGTFNRVAGPRDFRIYEEQGHGRRRALRLGVGGARRVLGAIDAD